MKAKDIFRSAINLEKIFLNNLPGKGFISKIYKKV